MRKLLRQTGTDTVYLFSSFPVALAAFVVAVTGFSVGVATAVVWIGVPVLAATLLALRGLAAAGRRPLTAVLRQAVPAPHYRRAAADASGLRRFLTAAADGQSWLNLLWAVVHFPIAVAAFAVAVAWWAAAVTSLTFPLYGWVLQRTAGGDGLEHATRWLGWGESYAASSLLALAGGLVLALLLPLVVRAWALTLAWLGRGLLASLETEPRHEDESATPARRTWGMEAELTRVRERLAKV